MVKLAHPILVCWAHGNPKGFFAPTFPLLVNILCISEKLYPSASDSLIPALPDLCFATAFQQLRRDFQAQCVEKGREHLVMYTENI